MQKLLKSTLAIVAFLIALGLLKPSIIPVGAADGDAAGNDPFGLGVSLDADDETVDFGKVEPDDSVKLATQNVHVAVGFHMGYDLSLETGDSGDVRLLGSGGAFINSMAGDGGLKSNTWGFRRSDVNGKWLGLLPDKRKQLIVSGDNAGESRNDDISVQFGVRVNTLTIADDYKNTVRYSVTARDLATPAVRTVSVSRLPTGEKRTIEFTGAKLDVATLGVDINGNKTLDSGEICTRTDDARNDANHFICELQVNDGDIIGTSKSMNILMRYQTDEGKDVTEDIGKAITYYRLPKFNGVNLGQGEATTAEIKISPKVKIRAIDTAGTSAIILGTDGTVWQDGRKILYDGSQTNDANWSNRASAAIEPRAGGIVSIASGMTSSAKPVYFAIGRDGAIYGWGDNTNKRLLVNGGDYIGLPTKADYHASTGKRPRQISVGGDFYALIGEGSDRDNDKLGLYSWGSGEHDALGIKDKKELWNNNGKAPERMTRDNITDDLAEDDYFTKVVTGDKHGLALTKNGQIVSWGARGDEDETNTRLAWKTTSDANQIHNIARKKEGSDKHYFTGDPRFTDIAAGDDFTIILDSTGLVYTFGGNDYGQLGRTATGESTKASGLMVSFGDTLNGDRVVGVSAKEYTALAWSRNGQLFTWGWTYQSNLPNTAKYSIDKPFKISGSEKVKFAAAGENIYAVAYGNDGSDKVYRWSSKGKEDITNQLRHPVYNARLSGTNLGHIGNIWVDYDHDGVLDDDEKSSVMARIWNSDISNDIQINTDNAPSGGGEYNLCADNGQGDANCGGVKVRIAAAKQTEITPIAESERQSKAKETPGWDDEGETVKPSDDVVDDTESDADSAVKTKEDEANRTDAKDNVNELHKDTQPSAGGDNDAHDDSGEPSENPGEVKTDQPVDDNADAADSSNGNEAAVPSEVPVINKTPQLSDAGLTSRRQDAIILSP